MTTPSAPARPAGRRRTGPLRTPTVLAVVLIVVELVIGAGAIYLSGGFEPAPATPVPKAAVGERIDAGRWNIGLVRAWRATKDPSSDSEWASKGRFLAVELDVTLTATESTTSFTDFQRGLVVRLPGGFTIDGTDPKSSPYRPTAVLADDQSLAQVHPGMSDRVLAVFELPRKQPWPDRIDVTIYRWEEAAGFVEAATHWAPAAEDPFAAQVVVPVKERAE